MRSPQISLFYLCLCLIFFAGSAWAKPPASSESAPDLSVESPPEPQPAGTYGEILFFPGAESRPSDERHQVQAGQKLDLCVRLSPQASQFIETMDKNAIGLQLLLEDASVPPHRLTIVLGNRVFRFRPDADACFGGDWQIPKYTKPGTYQVSDLLWATTDQSYYSLRRYLYEFSRVEELEVQNENADSEPPKLLGLHLYKKPPFNIAYANGVLRIRFEQAFEMVDEQSGIDQKSLRVLYQLNVGDDSAQLEEGKCRRVKQTNRFRCIVQAAAPDFFWSTRPLSLSLKSLFVKDRAGNELLLEGEEAFRGVAPQADLVFNFQRKKKWKARPDRDLRREAPLPVDGLKADENLPESLPQSG